MQGNTYTSQPISAAEIPLEDVTRVDIEFEQVDDSGASFEGGSGIVRMLWRMPRAPAPPARGGSSAG